MHTVLSTLIFLFHTKGTMNEENCTKAKKVRIVKKITRIDSEDYISVELKSSDETMDALLKKAISVTNTNQAAIAVTNTNQLVSNDKKLGVY